MDLRNAEPGRPISCIIGAEFTQKYIVQIDYARNTITAFRPQVFAPPANVASVHMRVASNKYYVPVTLTAGGRTRTRPERLDTESEETIADPMVANARVRRYSSLHNGEFSGQYDRVQVGPYLFTHVWAPFAPVGSIGTEILRRFRVTIDAPHERLYLEPNKHLSDPIPTPPPTWGNPPPKPLAVLQGRADGLVPAVQGTVDGQAMWFDLDTGGLTSYIDASLAHALRLHTVGNVSITGAGAGKVQALRLSPVAVRLGSVNFRAVKPIALDLSRSGTSLQQGGILGFDFYRRFVVAIDFKTYRVTLYEPRTYRYTGKGVAIPLVIRPPRAFVYATVAAQGAAPESHLLRLDVGSGDAVDDNIVLRSSAPKRVISGGVGIGNRFTSYLGTVSTLKIGPFVLHDLPSATGGVQLIGDEVWRRFNIVFDFSRSVMYLTPREVRNGSFIRRRAGFAHFAASRSLLERRNDPRYRKRGLFAIVTRMV
jgi:hypothetical protein